MNTKKVLELADFLETVPEEQFDLNWFICKNGRIGVDSVSMENVHTCGTTLCVAGWTVLWGGKTIPTEENNSAMLGLYAPIAIEAARLLELTEDEAAQLFYVAVGQANHVYPSGIVGPRSAALYIRRFVKNIDPVGYEAYFAAQIPQPEETNEQAEVIGTR